MRAVRLLADPATAGVVRRFSLGGIGSVSIDSFEMFEMLEDFLHRTNVARNRDTELYRAVTAARVDAAGTFLANAASLKELRSADRAFAPLQSTNPDLSGSPLTFKTLFDSSGPLQYAVTSSL